MDKKTQNESIDKANTLVEALPYISKFRGKTIVIKYGGNAMNDPQIIRTIMQDVATLKIVGVNPVLVHGGGPEINHLLDRLQIPSQFQNGLRVTDAATMDIVQMALTGKVNKNIVSLLNTLGVKAVGLSGKDGGLIQAEKMAPVNGIDYGFVGTVTKIDTKILRLLADDEYIPVIATVGVGANGETYNINADTAAGAIGGALGAEKLLYLTDIDGVRAEENNPASLLAQLNCAQIRSMIANGQIKGGMIPKVNACMDAIEKGVKNVLILNGTVPHSILLELFTDSGIGTMITA